VKFHPLGSSTTHQRNTQQASSADGKDGGLEFVKPPAESQPGDKIYFEGEKYEGEMSVCKKGLARSIGKHIMRL